MCQKANHHQQQKKDTHKEKKTRFVHELQSCMAIIPYTELNWYACIEVGFIIGRWYFLCPGRPQQHPSVLFSIPGA